MTPSSHTLIQKQAGGQGESPPLDVIAESIETPDIRKLATALSRNIWLLLLSIFTCLAAGYVYAFHIATPSYRSTTEIVLINNDVREAAEAEDQAPLAPDEEAVNTQVEVIRSDEVLEAVAERLDLYSDPEFNMYLDDKMESLAPILRASYGQLATVTELRKAIEARRVPDTHVVRISVVAGTSEKAQLIASSIAEEYRKREVSAKEERYRRSLQRLTGRVENLRASLISAESALEGFRSNELNLNSESAAALIAELEQRAAEVETIRRLYEAALSRYTEAQLAEGQQAADSYILNPANRPLEPFRPREKLILILSAVIGAMVGFSFVLLRESLSTVIKEPAELAGAVKVLVIGVAPMMKRSRFGRGARRQLGLDRPESIAAMEIIRTNLSMTATGGCSQAQCIALISSLPDEGKSSLAVALADSYAAAGARVLLIDADLRMRTISKWLCPEATAGLISVVGNEGALVSSATKARPLEFFMLAAEMPSDNPLRLLSSERFRQILGEARLQYQCIIFDTAPFFAVADARLICEAADVIVYVARRNMTTRQYLKEVVAELGSFGARIDAAVLTNVRFDRLDRARNGIARRYMRDRSRDDGSSADR